MADNVTLPGSGESVAADEIAGTKFQRMKMTLGADGVNDGDISAANPMPVELVGVDGAAPLPVYDDQVIEALAKMLRYLDSPRGFDSAQGRQRGTVVVESGTVTTLTTLTTCATVTNLSTIDTLQGRLQVLGQNLAAWQSCVRARIS